MSLTVQNVYDHIQPYLLRKLTKEQLEWVFNTEMIRLINDVTEDIAKITECNREWFHQKVSGQQFILAGEPTDFIQFKFYNELFSSIKWCVAEETTSGLFNTIVFSSSISSETRLSISYVRKIGTVELVTDTIDLPSRLEPDFETLLRTKCDTVYGDIPSITYEQHLQAMIPRMRDKVNNDFNEGTMGSMGGFVRDDFDYDILDNQRGNENVTADVDGIYSWTGEND